MALYCPDRWGEVLLLRYIVGLKNADNPVLHLFDNNEPLSDTTTKADLSECSAPGYEPITLLSAGWTIVQSGGVTSAVYSEVTFNFSSSAIAYGYYVTNHTEDDPYMPEDGPHLLWLERFSSSTGFEIPDGGGSVSITAKLTLS